MKEMSSISTLEFAWENKSLWSGLLVRRNIFLPEVALTNKLELLKWAREEKKCKWDKWTINTAAYQGNLEMVKYCVANECPIDEWTCAYAAKNGHLEVLKYLHEEVKAPWDSDTANWAAQMVIFIYSNILLSVSMINIANMRVGMRPRRSLGLFEVLTRNRQSALGRRSGTLRAQEQPNRLRTIPPRQRLPVTKRLAIRTRRVIRVVINVKIQKNVYHYSSTKRERNRLFSTRDVRYIASFFSLLSVRSKLESNNPIARHNFSALTHEHTRIEHLSKRTVSFLRRVFSGDLPNRRAKQNERGRGVSMFGHFSLETCLGDVRVGFGFRVEICQESRETFLVFGARGC